LLHQLSAREGRARFCREKLDGHCITPGFDFHVVIAFSAEVLAELLAGSEQAIGRVPEFLPLGPAARLALESIRRGPFAGPCRAMALSARCHDLIVEFLSSLVAAPQPRPPRPLASLTDRVRAAADILQRNLEHPPSIAALAAEAGLSETTLKRTFSQIFGNTVYGYLRTRRMERARHLLETGATTVLEAATLVGYSNPSNFAAAFRRQFGLNPKAFQIAVRR
jgi:AraC-like DNA-binding protein